jgi:hypothetical protein
LTKKGSGCASIPFTLCSKHCARAAPRNLISHAFADSEAKKSKMCRHILNAQVAIKSVCCSTFFVKKMLASEIS